MNIKFIQIDENGNTEVHEVYSFDEYQEKVYDYLEYIGYPQYVIDFDPKQVAQSIYTAMRIFYVANMGYRLAACSIFGATMNFQIMHRSDITKH
jgi:hypothetical protein